MRNRVHTVVKSMDPEGRLPVVPLPLGKSPDLPVPVPSGGAGGVTALTAKVW